MINKIRITKKVARACAPCLLSVGYCNIQRLLLHLSPYAYSAGVYGWACDYYHVGHDVVISTGYRPIGLPVPYSLCQKYENAAAKACKTHTPTKAREYISNVLLPRFVSEAKKAATKGEK